MNRRKKIFERVVNPLIIKYLTDPFSKEISIAKGIPIKYLKYFKEVSSTGIGKKVRYRFRGESMDGIYDRPQSFCHKLMAQTFAIYHR